MAKWAGRVRVGSIGFAGQTSCMSNWIVGQSGHGSRVESGHKSG